MVTKRRNMKEFVDQKVHDIFLDVQRMLNIQSGDITPGLYLELEGAENRLSEAIETALYAQIEMDNESDDDADFGDISCTEYVPEMHREASDIRMRLQGSQVRTGQTEIVGSPKKYAMENYLFAYLSAGCTVFRKGDRYEAVAHIASAGKITWYCSPALLDAAVTEKIQSKSEEHRRAFSEWLLSFPEDQQYVILSERVPYAAWRYAADMGTLEEKLKYLKEVLMETSHFE